VRTWTKPLSRYWRLWLPLCDGASGVDFVN